MENNDNFNRILEMNTEAERRRIAAQIAATMAPHWLCMPGESSLVSDEDLYKTLASMAVSAADALIAELNKKKD